MLVPLANKGTEMIHSIIQIYRVMILFLYAISCLICAVLTAAGGVGLLLGIGIFVSTTLFFGASVTLVGIYDRISPVAEVAPSSKFSRPIVLALGILVFLILAGALFTQPRDISVEAAGLLNENTIAGSEPRHLSPPDKNGCVKELAEAAGLRC